VKVKQVAFMANHLGDEYAGVISGILPHGFFVRLENMGVEGMVRVSSIDDDYYHFDEKSFRLVGRRTGRVFRLGDAVRVSVMRVDRTRNEIDLFMIEQQVKRTERRARRSGASGAGRSDRCEGDSGDSGSIWNRT